MFGWVWFDKQLDKLDAWTLVTGELWLRRALVLGGGDVVLSEKGVGVFKAMTRGIQKGNRIIFTLVTPVLLLLFLYWLAGVYGSDRVLIMLLFGIALTLGMILDELKKKNEK